MSHLDIIKRAKERLLIPQLWERRGWPGIPGKSCIFPDGTDKHASASVFKGGRLLNCFRSGRVFDAPALMSEVEGLSIGDACREFIKLAGFDARDTSSLQSNQIPAMPRDIARTKPKFPPMDEGSADDRQILAELRSVSVKAVTLAVERGLLRFAHSMEGRSWVVLDSTRWTGIARRMDGQGWQCLRGAKARMLRGSWASWPIGASEAATFTAIALVEGGPDMLAALHFAIAQGVEQSLAIVCMGSSGISIPLESLSHFERKRIRIFLDDDIAGATAFKRWADQLHEAGAIVDGFSFDGLSCANGKPAKDFNDCCSLSNESLQRWGTLIDSCMKFAPAEAGKPSQAFHLTHLPRTKESQQLKKSMKHPEPQTPIADRLTNDPVILQAIEIFKGRNLALIEAKKGASVCLA